MTEKELLDYGYEPKLCKNGTLYFRGDFHCKLKEDGYVDLRYNQDDMYTFALVNTFEELLDAERSYYNSIKENYERKIKLAQMIIEMYDEKLKKLKEGQ